MPAVLAGAGTSSDNNRRISLISITIRKPIRS
jgi:hypothetical protein